MVEEVYEEIAVLPVHTAQAVSQLEDSSHFNTQNIVAVKPEVKPVVKEFQVSDFFDIDSNIFKGDSEPRTEFDFLLNKVLTAIKEVIFAHSVAFFWANREKQQMVMESRVTDSTKFISSRRFSKIGRAHV